ncbi:beta-glucosidase [Nocardia sp. 2]|uniref:Beta-glucosidase n=1 Tax=Nocardia acididurans TaxID=2802282 RepID=A0ABS1MAV7_9NOCA|nr:GH1 family beta-glucosidase [Nocardia acididurans]MBL1077761.1 beta-glucosidase [Nocardia acididurans]
MTTPEFDLPPHFRFGMATAAIQIEGATRADGRGVSIWDTFAAQPGRIHNGDSLDIATDHYHRYRADIADLRDCGVDDYRFSIAWPRVVPQGRGEVNPKGLDFYDRLVDGLLEAGIRPVPTLYHWDLPQPLQDEGGWLARATAEAFAEYARVVADKLGDRVRDWLTLNEMNVHTLYGHVLADHAPALDLGLAAFPAAHYQLLAHGLAVRELRAAGDFRIGVVGQHYPVIPASDEAADVEAADTFAALTNWTFADPILLGHYPAEEIAALVAGTAGLSAEQLAADLEIIAAPLDFYGVNYYEPVRIEARREGKDYSGVLEVDIPADMPFAPVPFEDGPRTDFGWTISPSGFEDILNQMRERYPHLPPVVITESGASFHDEPGPDGAIHDTRRIDYLHSHIDAVAKAIANGVDVRGYYVWSALDNFEWAAGYEQRFGLVHVDWTTLERTRKDSWHWYRDAIAAHRDRSSSLTQA